MIDSSNLAQRQNYMESSSQYRILVEHTL